MQNRLYRRFFVFAIATFVVFSLILVLPVSRAADEKKVVLYTAITATTSQIPLWYAVKEEWPKGYALHVEYWKNLDDLRGTMLARKGDIWVGDLKGFAQAAKRGAPVTLVAVTAWKKFYFVASGKETAATLEGIADDLRKTGEKLAVAPQDGPAPGILEKIRSKNGPAFEVAPMAPQQLMLEMIRGSRRYALIPEPFLSSLLAKKPDVRIVASLEEEFARHFGGKARLPLAGIAVNTAFAKANPEMLAKLVRAMQVAELRLAGKPKEAAALLPKQVRDTLGIDVIEASLARDLIHVETAWQAREQIADFLQMVMPELRKSAKDGLPSDSFILPEPK